MYTGKADRLNELPGIELEGKLKIASNCTIDQVAEVIFGALSQSYANNDNIYGISPNASLIRPSCTRAHYYGYRDESGAIQKAFTVMERVRDGHLQVKRKAVTSTVYQGNVFDRKEEVVPIDWPSWNEETAQVIAIQESANTGYVFDPTQVFLVVNTTERRKLKIRVHNRLNNRNYTIGVDETSVLGKGQMQQVEIEYIGMEIGTEARGRFHSLPIEEITLKEIVDEIKAIEQIIIVICAQANIVLKPTDVTKFDWLLTLVD